MKDHKNIVSWIAVIIASISLGWQIYSHFNKPEPVYSFDEFEVDRESLKESIETLINDGRINFWAKICLKNLTQWPGRKMKSQRWTIKLQMFEIIKKGEVLSRIEVVRKTPEFDDGNIKDILTRGEQIKLMGKQGGWIKIEYDDGKEGWIDKKFIRMTNKKSGEIDVNNVFVRNAPRAENGNRTEWEVSPREQYLAIKWVNDSNGKQWVKIENDSGSKSGFISADNFGNYKYDCKVEQEELKVLSGELNFELFAAKDYKTKKNIVIQDFETGFVNYKAKQHVPKTPELLEIYDQKIISPEVELAIFQLGNIENLSKEEKDDLLKNKIGLKFKYGRQCIIVAAIGLEIIPGVKKVRITPNKKTQKILLYGIFEENTT